MMDWGVKSSIKRLLVDQPKAKLYLALAGSGIGTLLKIQEIPGVSQVLHGARLIYGKEDMTNFLGFEVTQAVSENTSIYLAMEAYTQAAVNHSTMPIGIGLTTAIASNREHKGKLRGHATIISDKLMCTCEFTLQPGVGENARRQHNDTIDLVLEGLLQSTVSKETTSYPVVTNCSEKALRLFLEMGYFGSNGFRGNSERNGPPDAVIFPGSFNPVHDTHLQMAKSVSEELRKPVVLLVSTDPPHKSQQPVTNFLRIVNTVRKWNSSYIGPAGQLHVKFHTGLPLFVDKARFFSDQQFIVGADTLDRLLDSKWGLPTWEVINRLKNSRTQLIVFDRILEDDSVLMLRDVLDQYRIWPYAKSNFRQVPHTPSKISSSGLRAEIAKL